MSAYKPTPLYQKAQTRMYHARAALQDLNAQILELNKRRERFLGEISAAEDILDLIEREESTQPENQTQTP